MKLTVALLLLSSASSLTVKQHNPDSMSTFTSQSYSSSNSNGHNKVNATKTECKNGICKQVECHDGKCDQAKDVDEK